MGVGHSASQERDTAPWCAHAVGLGYVTGVVRGTDPLEVYGRAANYVAGPEKEMKPSPLGREMSLTLSAAVMCQASSVHSSSPVGGKAYESQLL